MLSSLKRKENYVHDAIKLIDIFFLLFSIVKIGLQQFSWTTDNWDIR
jgi:hypothetical protein